MQGEKEISLCRNSYRYRAVGPLRLSNKHLSFTGRILYPLAGNCRYRSGETRRKPNKTRIALFIPASRLSPIILPAFPETRFPDNCSNRRFTANESPFVRNRTPRYERVTSPFQRRFRKDFPKGFSERISTRVSGTTFLGSR